MRITFIIVIVVIGIVIAYFMTLQQKADKPLPIIQPKDVKKEMVHEDLLNKGRGHRVGDFAFKNQFGDVVTTDSIKGKVVITEYFFTTCGTICPKMTEQMTRIQDRFRNHPEVKIVSFTVNPEHDTVEVMHEYANKYGAERGQWHFLTGEKEKLYSLARTSFFVLKPAEAANTGDVGSDFIHTNNFVLVDQKLRIRGYYDGTDKEEVDQLMEDIVLLLGRD